MMPVPIGIALGCTPVSAMLPVAAVSVRLTVVINPACCTDVTVTVSLLVLPVSVSTPLTVPVLTSTVVALINTKLSALDPPSIDLLTAKSPLTRLIVPVPAAPVMMSAPATPMRVSLPAPLISMSASDFKLACEVLLPSAASNPISANMPVPPSM